MAEPTNIIEIEFPEVELSQTSKENIRTRIRNMLADFVHPAGVDVSFWRKRET